MQGNVGALNKSAFISMFIQKPLGKEHPVLACVWWVLPLLLEVPGAGAGEVLLGLWKWVVCWAELLHARSCSWPGGEAAAAAALLGATAA